MEKVGNMLPLFNPPPRPGNLVGIAPPRLDTHNATYLSVKAGNAQGVKLQRPRLRVLPRSAFQQLPSISEVSDCLFGVSSGAGARIG